MSRGVYQSRRGPVTAEWIENVENRIRHQLGGRLRDFRLEVADAGIVLYGHAPTYYVKQLAQHAIMAATAVPILRNEIEVV